MDLTILIPCRNEETCVAKTIEDILVAFHGANISFEILLVNNNSSDTTENILMEYQKVHSEIRYINTTVKRGFGVAVKQGIETSQGRNIVVVMADASECPADILRFFYKIEEGFDCVFGSRFLEGNNTEGYPLLKLQLNRLGNYFLSKLTKSDYNDFTSGFKCYSAKKLASLGPLYSNNFSISLEIAIKLYLAGSNIAVLGHSWRERKSGKSKFNIIREIISYVWTTFLILKNETTKQR